MLEITWRTCALDNMYPKLPKHLDVTGMSTTVVPTDVESSTAAARSLQYPPKTANRGAVIPICAQSVLSTAVSSAGVPRGRAMTAAMLERVFYFGQVQHSCRRTRPIQQYCMQ